MSSSEAIPEEVGETRHAALSCVPVIARLAPDVRDLVTESFQPMAFAFGDTIVAQGDEPDGFYVIASGIARVLVTGRDGSEIALRPLHAGDFFGEIALLDEVPRSATVRASSPLEVL